MSYHNSQTHCEPTLHVASAGRALCRPSGRPGAPQRPRARRPPEVRKLLFIVRPL
jgi:hypothetical protein